MSIGYWLGDQYEGKGIISMSCKALVDYIFHDLELNRIEIRCAQENTRSQRIPETLGFTKEGILRESEWLYDRFSNSIIYALLKNEWDEKRKT